MQVWWLPDPADPTKPTIIPVALAQGVSVPVPQVLLRRHWPHVEIDATEVRRLGLQQNTTNKTTFADKPAGYWLLESIQAKQLYGGLTTRSAIDHYEITIIWRGDPVRHHELWYADFGGGVIPIRPASMSFNDLAAVHKRFTIFQPSDLESFNGIIPDGKNCDPLT